MTSLHSGRALSYKPALQRAFQDFPFPAFKLEPDSTVNLREDVVHADVCSFDPTQLVTDHFGASALQGRNHLEGLGIIDVEDRGEGEYGIVGMFMVENQEDANGELIYPKGMYFWGDYDLTNRKWIISFS